MTSVEEFITAKAEAVGFAAVGFAKAGPSETAPLFEQWLNDGMAADMEYLRRHERLRQHPNKLADGVRSIVAVAARYPVNAAPGSGFSTYARGLDYHDVIRAKLREVVNATKEQYPISLARICVDSAPLSEREWAARAGLGWIGKQGQLVHPTAGCCLLLGFVLVDLKLTPSAPVQDRCCDCNRCVTACPTGAALGDRRVDARRCISYLTIEHKQDIPPDLRTAVAGALFGCDCCTAVCPWNDKATGPVMPEFLEKSPLPTAAECLSLTETTFRQRFGNNVVWRTGLERLKHNAELAS